VEVLGSAFMMITQSTEQDINNSIGLDVHDLGHGIVRVIALFELVNDWIDGCGRAHRKWMCTISSQISLL
jgi:hypothetical protein